MFFLPLSSLLPLVWFSASSPKFPIPPPLQCASRTYPSSPTIRSPHIDNHHTHTHTHKFLDMAPGPPPQFDIGKFNAPFRVLQLGFDPFKDSRGTDTPERSKVRVRRHALKQNILRSITSCLERLGCLISFFPLSPGVVFLGCSSHCEKWAMCFFFLRDCPQVPSPLWVLAHKTPLLAYVLLA